MCVCHEGHYEGLRGAEQMSACGELCASWRRFLYIGVHVKPRLHAWHSHRQSRSHFALSSLSDQGEIRLFFHFSKLFFIQNYRFLYHGDQKISWWTSMQVAGNQLRNPPVKFRQERSLHIWRSICIQHVQMEAGLNSDPGNDSFSDKIRDAKHVEKRTGTLHGAPSPGWFL